MRTRRVGPKRASFGLLVGAVSSGGPVVSYAEPSAEALVDGVRGDMAAIRQVLRVVTNNGPGNVGGGGTPRAPQAPPLD